MSLDYSALLYDPVYREIGVEATLGAVAITVIDDTRAKTLPAAAASADVRSVGPAAVARIPELTAAGVTRDNWLGATLTFNGRSWTVRSYELRGSPNGEDQGEVRFLLKVSSDGPTTAGVWILATGLWNNAGIWINSAMWQNG